MSTIKEQIKARQEWDRELNEYMASDEYTPATHDEVMPHGMPNLADTESGELLDAGINLDYSELAGYHLDREVS